jgi:hypothetical protein
VTIGHESRRLIEGTYYCEGKISPEDSFLHEDVSHNRGTSSMEGKFNLKYANFKLTKSLPIHSNWLLASRLGSDFWFWTIPYVDT